MSSPAQGDHCTTPAQSSFWRLTLFYPNLTRAIENVQSMVLAEPVYICVACGSVQHNQQAMAGHCKLHIQAHGMAKGTVRHIKYNTDHTFSLMCHPSPDEITEMSPISGWYLTPAPYDRNRMQVCAMGTAWPADPLWNGGSSGVHRHQAAVLSGGQGVARPAVVLAPVADAAPSIDLVLRLGLPGTAGR